MDYSKLFKGQKIDLTCPNCERKFKIDASLAFKKNSVVTCPSCSEKINLDTTDSRKKLDKTMKDFKKLFK